MSTLTSFRLAFALVMAVTVSNVMHAQSVQGTETRPGTLVGTATDVNGDPVPDATVVLAASKSGAPVHLSPPEMVFSNSMM